MGDPPWVATRLQDANDDTSGPTFPPSGGQAAPRFCKLAFRHGTLQEALDEVLVDPPINDGMTDLEDQLPGVAAG